MAESFLTEGFVFFLKNADGGLSVVQFSRYPTKIRNRVVDTTVIHRTYPRRSIVEGQYDVALLGLAFCSVS